MSCASSFLSSVLTSCWFPQYLARQFNLPTGAVSSHKFPQVATFPLHVPISSSRDYRICEATRKAQVRAGKCPCYPCGSYLITSEECAIPTCLQQIPLVLIPIRRVQYSASGLGQVAQPCSSE
ncbi:hypothetical protein C8R46DRAFT_1135658 [Mycena filopes]|nr:hypothetical protein C8R46DRAFT_1135658 [Mycena filopes]